MAIDKKLIEQLLTGLPEAEDIIGENGLLKQLTKSHPGTRLASRTDRASGLREARPGGPSPGQHAQREKPKDLAGRLRGAGVGDPRDRHASFEPKDRGQAADASGTFLRSTNHLDCICAGMTTAKSKATCKEDYGIEFRH